MNLPKKNLPEKFRAAEERVSQEWGAFNLFALIERQETLGQWDLVVAAPWIETDRDGIARVADLLKPKLNDPDWLYIGRIVPLKLTDDFVQSLVALYPAEHELRQIPSSVIDGVPINHAYVITANKKHIALITEREPVAA